MSPPSSLPPAAHDRVLALVQRFGWNATSFQALDPGLRHFWHGDDACVAYVDTGRAWVGAGAPLAVSERLGEVTRAFVAAAARARRRVCFFAVEARLVDASGLRSLPIGEQPVWDPTAWPDIVRSSRSLREQLRRAAAKDVRVRAAAPEEIRDPASPLLGALQAITRRWLRAREMAPMRFLVRVDPVTLLPEHRLYVAERQGAPIAFLQAAPIFARGGWLLQNLLRVPGAPNGVSELLIDAAMRAAAAEKLELVTLGLAPLAGDVPRVLRAARALGRPLFDFAGLRAFRAKLKPAEWVPQFLAFPREQGALRSLRDALEAFAGGGLLRFAVATLARGPLVAVRALALLLIPWTGILAASRSSRWFPCPAIKWMWVVFDVALVIGLARLSRRWRHWLAKALTVAIGVDALATTLEAWAWNVPRHPSPFEAGVVGLAIAAPTVAFILLSQALRRHGAERGR